MGYGRFANHDGPVCDAEDFEAVPFNFFTSEDGVNSGLEGISMVL